MSKYSKKDIFGLFLFIGIAIAFVFSIFMSKTVYDAINNSALLLMHIVFLLIHINFRRVGDANTSNINSTPQNPTSNR